MTDRACGDNLGTKVNQKHLHQELSSLDGSFEPNEILLLMNKHYSNLYSELVFNHSFHFINL